jgi:hypothetical protein
MRTPEGIADSVASLTAFVEIVMCDTKDGIDSEACLTPKIHYQMFVDRRVYPVKQFNEGRGAQAGLGRCAAMCVSQMP